jgi:hypothetical protein
MEIDHETGKPPAFNMVPEPDQGKKIFILYSIMPNIYMY